jgi:hypothetical protein
MPKYIVVIKDAITYYGHVKMSEEEYEKLSLEDKDEQIKILRSKLIMTDKLEEKELIDFYPLF